jgi:hypothetical protein
MNLHGLVTGAISAVNPPVNGSVQISTGNTIGADGSTTPQFATYSNVWMQVQAVTGPNLRQVQALNLQGVTRVVYMNGFIEGLDRPAGKGGDILNFLGASWLVVGVIEEWDTDGWCKVGVTKQGD